MKFFISFIFLFASLRAQAAKEVALTFDDAPTGDTAFFKSTERAEFLVHELKTAKVPPVIIFTNPCHESRKNSIVNDLKIYTDSGNIVGNHTCTHPDLDKVGQETFLADTAKADTLLAPLIEAKAKYFRFPFLHEGEDAKTRDEVSSWLKQRGYQQGKVSIDTDDYLATARMKEAKKQGLKVDKNAVARILTRHLIGALDHYDKLAQTTLGRSPKHVILLHEMDATVLGLDSFIAELRSKGWTIISAPQAYEDEIYQRRFENTYCNDGVIAQAAFEKTGQKRGFKDSLDEDLKKELGLKSSF